MYFILIIYQPAENDVNKVHQKILLDIYFYLLEVFPAIRWLFGFIFVSFLILGKFKWINVFLFPLKSSENHTFCDDFGGNRS